MTVKELANKYKENYPDLHFFDKDTLNFFGERFTDMKVLKETVKVPDAHGNVHECYVLSSLQRNAPFGAKRVRHYFDVNTYQHIICDYT